ncbi:Extracellular phospholipase A1 precursor [Serratia entomophila]|uniref:phospholipase n=1 Tax=Serratia entomophila TaxID=42906 RepID=UPI002178974D|nr:phospholipase [Serratia entomophila]CAI1917038.1 Extracellular phospholipase A1 precursor [Serratia entomophila]CAI2929110.1 Extracellular phospholipase A1 precursor [Serratia entomophila]
MSMSLSFTSAVSPVAMPPAAARAQPEAARPAPPVETPGAQAPAAAFSQNGMNARNLLDSLVSDISAAAAPAASPGVSRGQQSQQGDYALALLAKDVYSLNGQGVAGFTRLSDSALLGAGIDPASLHDAASGFQAGIYSDDNQYVLAFAGTNDWRDWLSNVRQATGYDDAQYNQAVAVAKTAKAAFGGALATGTVAVTFNAAGVSDYTLNRLGIDPAAAKRDAEAGGIRRYSEQYDMLTSTQESTSLIPDAIGHNITLANGDILSGIDDWRPSKHLDRSLTAHGIDKVIGSMAEQKPWEAKANA